MPVGSVRINAASNEESIFLIKKCPDKDASIKLNI